MANFQFISKNNIGCVFALLLVILLSQSKIFNILLDTVLGRTILIAFLLVISYLNKILGVVSVLIIIIVFNNSSIGYMEGFTTDASNNATPPATSSTTSSTTSLTTPPSTTSSTTPPAPPIKSTTSPTTPPTPPSTSSSTSSSTTPSTSSSTSPANVSTATEGFDIIGKESNIKRGKQSNSIPVNDFMRESTSVAPYEGSSYLESFSAF